MKSRILTSAGLALLVLTAIAAPAAAAQRHNTQLMQVVLLAGSRSGESNLDALPANTRQAITDIRQFLPFRSYEILDASLMRSDEQGSTRMSGPNGADYEVSFSFSQASDSDEIHVDHFKVIKHPLVSRQLLEPPRTRGSDDREAPVSAPVEAKVVIRTSFAAPIGETVVVGTSRLNGGDQALVVLFTALE